MKKKNYCNNFIKILVLVVFIIPISSFAICVEPNFPTSFSSKTGYTEDSLAGSIVNHYKEDWCGVDKLCPVGVVRTNGDCGEITGVARTVWQNVIGSEAMPEFFDTDKIYYAKKLCQICKNANSNPDGSGVHDSGPKNPTDQPPKGTQTTVVVGGFDTLDNPLGPAKLTTVSDVLERALSIIIKVSIPFVVLMLIWTGFQFVIAQGNSTKVSAAKNTLLWVIVGAAILIGCVAIANAIANSVQTVAKAASGEQQ